MVVAKAEPSKRTVPLESVVVDDDGGVTLTTTTTQRRGARAAAPPAELVDQREHDACTGHADGVTERDRATVDVGHLVGDAEVGHRRDADRSERLVQLEEVDVADRQPGAGERLLDRARRLVE